VFYLLLFITIQVNISLGVCVKKNTNILLMMPRRIVSFKLISFIVHEGLKISEQLTIAKLQKSPNIHLKVRHLHLVRHTTILYYYIIIIILLSFINSLCSKYDYFFHTT